MNHKKFVILFVVWFHANTLTSSPISSEGKIKLKCGHRCTSTTEDRLQVEEYRKNQAFLESVLLKRNKRQVDNTETDAKYTLSNTESTNVSIDDKLDVKQSSHLSLQPNITSKDDTDVTSLIEYEKAQENLLSASEKVKDSQVSPDAENAPEDTGLLITENLSESNKQPSTDSEDLKNIQQQTNSSDTISSLNKPQLLSGVELTIEISEKSAGVMSVDNLDGDTLIITTDNPKAPATSEESTGLKSEADHVEGDTLTAIYESSYAPEISNESAETKLNQTTLLKSTDEVNEDTKAANTNGDDTANDNFKSPAISEELSGKNLNENEAPVKPGDDAEDDTLIGKFYHSKVPAIPEEPTTTYLETENTTTARTSEKVDDSSNATEILPVKSGDEVKGDKISNAINTSKAIEISEGTGAVIKSNESDIPTNKTLAIVDTSGHHTASKLDPETGSEELVTPTTRTLEDTRNTPTTSEIGSNTPVGSSFLDKTETPAAFEKFKKTLTIPNIPTAPQYLPVTDATKGMFYKIDETGSTDHFKDDFLDHHHSDMHDFDDFDDLDEYIIHKEPFEDFMEDPCSDDCESPMPGGLEENNSNSLRYQNEYLTKHDDMMEDHEHPADNIDYSPHIYGTSKHFHHFDDFDPVKDSDDSFDSEVEFNNRKAAYVVHTSICDDDFDEKDDDEFDDNEE